MKKFIFIGIALGGAMGAWIGSKLDGGFGGWSIMLGFFIGPLLGIWASYKAAQVFKEG